jgi:hypothetical protein
MRKSITRKRGKSFTAAGIGLHGPYVVHTQRVAKGLYAKITGGARGVTTGLKYNGKGNSFEFGINHSTNAPYVKIKKRSKR